MHVSTNAVNKKQKNKKTEIKLCQPNLSRVCVQLERVSLHLAFDKNKVLKLSPSESQWLL